MTDMAAVIVYVLCALTSSLCASLLLAKYFKSGVRLLLWSGLCFAGLGLSNIFLVVDLVLLPGLEFTLARTLPTVGGIGILLWGFIWDSA
jgi:hypothetical protein